MIKIKGSGMYNTFNIVGTDPGTNTTGVATFTLDNNLNIIAIESFTLDSSRCVHERGTNLHLDYKTVAISNRLERHLLAVNPVAVSVESPFIFMKRPTSIIPLARVMDTIVSTVLRLSPHTYVKRVPPSSVKNAIGAKGNADKDMMYYTLKNHPELSNYFNIDNISEHEIDSIAVCYALLLEMRSNDTVMINI